MIEALKKHSQRHPREGSRKACEALRRKRARVAIAAAQFGYDAVTSTRLSTKRSGLSGSGDAPLGLHAGHVDGHVESYSPANTRAMYVIIQPETNEPYEPGVGPGSFYIPRVGIR